MICKCKHAQECSRSEDFAICKLNVTDTPHYSFCALTCQQYDGDEAEREKVKAEYFEKVKANAEKFADRIKLVQETVQASILPVKPKVAQKTGKCSGCSRRAAKEQSNDSHQ